MKSGILNSTIRSLFLLPFLIPSRKEMRKLTKTRPAKETEFHSMTSRNAETREEKMKHVYCHTEKHTFSFAKSKNGTQTPSLTPYSFPPSPSSSVSGYSIILRILKFFEDTPDFRIQGRPDFFPPKSGEPGEPGSR